MSKKTKIDKAIDGLEAEIAVLQLAKARLVTQRAISTAIVRGPRVVEPVKDERVG